jgi:hypothetical protein
MAAGQGMYNVMPDEYEPTNAEEDDLEPTDEIVLVNDLAKTLNFDALLPNIVKNTLIAGFCPLEIGTVGGVKPKLPSKWATKIIHPATVIEIVMEEGTPKNYHGIEKSRLKGKRRPLKLRART